MRFFQDTPLLPDDAIFRLPQLFAQDARPSKVNLGIGVYQDESGKNVVFSSVQKAEAKIVARHLDKNYLPIDGNATFIQQVPRLIFGADNALLDEKRVFCVETVGGASALRVGAEFLCMLNRRTLYLSDPSWVNHYNIFARAGLEVCTYPYFAHATQSLDFSALCSYIKTIPAGSIFLMQGCGHNPTGVDPSQEQWRELCHLLQEQSIIPFFDLAYHGLCTNFHEDSFAIRHFAQQGHELLISYSFSKNMGLYGERVGALIVVAAESKTLRSIASQVRQIIRGLYSTPPLQGGRIAALVLEDEPLRNEWQSEVEAMRQRLQMCRQNLACQLNAYAKHADYSFINRQKGMFSFCGLTPSHVERLIKEYAIYLTADGRINIAGLNSQNTAYVAKSIVEVCGT